jgi:hypothetical protein
MEETMAAQIHPDRDAWLAEQAQQLEAAEARLARYAAALRELINRSRREDECDLIPPELVALAYHHFRIAAERFDQGCRLYVDTL